MKIYEFFALLGIMTPTMAMAADHFSGSLASQDFYEDRQDDPAPSGPGALTGEFDQLSELALNQEERRHTAAWGAAAALGESSLWMSAALRAYKFSNDDFAWTCAIGTGKYRVYQTPEGHARFHFDMANAGVGIGGLWWPSHTFPLAVFSNVSAQSWSGRAVSDSSDLDPAITSGGFTAITVTADTGIMVFWLADSGMFWEWTVLGVGRSYVASARTDGDVEGRALRRTLGDTRAFGIVNVGVGYRF